MAQRIFSSLLMAAVVAFSAFFWYVNTSLHAKSIEPGLSEGAATTLQTIAQGNSTYFLPLLFGLMLLSSVVCFLSYSSHRQSASVSESSVK